MNEAFEGITGAKEGTAIVAGEQLKIALVGKPKSGKSWCAATMPGPTLVYDFDGRIESLANLPKEYKSQIQVKTLQDLSQTAPTAFAALEGDLSILKYRKQQGKAIPASFVFDSATYLFKAVENIYFKSGGSKLSLKISPTTSLLRRAGWDGINAVVGAFEYLISEYSALGNICFVFHERPEKDKAESTKEMTAYTDKVTVDPQFLAVLLSRFNDVFRVEIDYNQNYMITCKPTKEFDAASIFTVDQKEIPNIQLLIKKHKEKQANGV